MRWIMLNKDLQERNQIIKQIVLEQCAVREKLGQKKLQDSDFTKIEEKLADADEMRSELESLKQLF